MAGPLLYFVAAAGSRIAHRFATKKAAQAFARRQGGKVVTQPPKGARIRPGDNARSVGSSSSKPSGRDYSMKSRTNAGPRKLSGNPASLRTSEIMGKVPEVTTRGTPTKRLDKKGETPKKTVTPTKRLDRKGETPKADPKKKTSKTEGGEMTLRKYLNDAISERGSSVTAEKKGAEKYGSISAAKKAGSLYYKNRKTGKVMAAVYKEDLKK